MKHTLNIQQYTWILYVKVNQNDYFVCYMMGLYNNCELYFAQLLTIGEHIF